MPDIQKEGRGCFVIAKITWQDMLNGWRPPFASSCVFWGSLNIERNAMLHPSVMEWHCSISQKSMFSLNPYDNNNNNNSRSILHTFKIHFCVIECFLCMLMRIILLMTGSVAQTFMMKAYPVIKILSINNINCYMSVFTSGIRTSKLSYSCHHQCKTWSEAVTWLDCWFCSPEMQRCVAEKCLFCSSSEWYTLLSM